LKTNRETDRETEIQTDRQTDWQTGFITQPADPALVQQFNFYTSNSSLNTVSDATYTLSGKLSLLSIRPAAIFPASLPFGYYQYYYWDNTGTRMKNNRTWQKLLCESV